LQQTGGGRSSQRTLSLDPLQKMDAGYLALQIASRDRLEVRERD
jgi:hypothetical protein